MHLTLNSGRRIHMVGLRQWPSYYGVLAGKPYPEGNARIIDEALALARDLAPGKKAAVLLPPPPGDALPRIVTIAVFDSGELLKPGSEPYSSLAVVWFQDRFGLPGEPVEAHIAALDWERLAEDWIW